MSLDTRGVQIANGSKNLDDEHIHLSENRQGPQSSNKASDALMVHIRRVSKDPLLVVHSLRHTFSTMCRNASLDWELREFVVGRGAGSGASSHYGQVHWVGRQLLEMSKMDYSFLDQFKT